MMHRYVRPSSRPATRVITGETTQRRVLEQGRIRLNLVILFFGIWFLALSIRLVEVTLLGSNTLPFKRLVSEPSLMVQKEEEERIKPSASTLHARRREIVDRHGMVMATSIDTASLAANPKLIRRPQEVAKSLSQVLRLSYPATLAKLKHPNSNFTYIKRHLTPREQQEVNALGIPGLFFEDTERRIYPYGALFSHVLGYVDIDNKGIAGIEQHFNSQLSDALKADEPLKLSLDLRVQSILAEEMKNAVNEFNAVGATGIITEIDTGEVIAMSNLPEFDPNRPTASGKAEDRFNRAALGAYEMGSTFKTFTLAMALENKRVKLQDSFDTVNPIRYASFTITDAHPEGRWLSVPEIYAYSSNIGAVRIAQMVGGNIQQEFFRDLGFMQPVDIELPERSRPLVPKQWSQLNMMTMSFGHGISISPLHLMQAMATMVNGGTRSHLTLVKDGNKGRPKGDRVISEKTSDQMRRLMRVVVEFGTAKKAEAPGYMVGGKTGTAEKVVNGVYKKDAKLASFVGVFPTNKPKYAILVMIDEPKGNKKTYGYATGGWVAAPVVSGVVARMGGLYGMQPSFNEAPDVEMAHYWLKDKPIPRVPAPNSIQQISAVAPVAHAHVE